MSIASEITRINGNITAAYTACSGKGATMPQTQNSANLADTIDSIQQGGGTSALDDYVDGSVTDVVSNVTTVKSYAFGYDDSITSVSLPSATQIQNNALLHSAIRSISAPEVTLLQASACAECARLTTISMPKLAQAQNSAFSDCTALASVSLPLLTSVLFGEFKGCTNLTDVNIPLVQSLSQRMFYGCTKLEVIDLPSCTYIGRDTFWACGMLNTIVLRSSTVCGVYSTDSLGRTPFASNGTGGTVYVPQAMLSSYQSSTNWSAFNVTFRSIEGSIYEGVTS